MDQARRRNDSPLVTALFAALDLACDHSDIEIIRRLSQLIDRLAAQDEAERGSGGAGGAERPLTDR